MLIGKAAMKLTTMRLQARVQSQLASVVILTALASLQAMTQPSNCIAAPVDVPAAKRDAASKVDAARVEASMKKDQAASSEEHKPNSVAEVIERVNRGVVLITSHDSKGNDLGLGSGFVIDASGLVATNFHVLRLATTVDATFVDGTKVDIVGCRAWDEDSDLAILQLAKPLKNMQVASLCQNTERRQAADVIAIGHPQGFKFTTTTGIISAVHTTEELPRQYRNTLSFSPPDNVWIQTNAAISGGSSGGPLLNSAGEVIGINTWIAMGQNLGFAADVRHLIALTKKMKPNPMAFADLTGPEESLKNLVSEFGDHYMWFQQELRNAGTKEAKQELIDAKHPALEYLPKIYTLADKHRGLPVAFAALEAACYTMSRLPDCPKACNATFKLVGQRLMEDYSSSPRMMSALLGLSNASLDEAITLLRRISVESKSPKLQAAALCALARNLMRDKDNAKNRAEAVAALERIMKEFAKVEVNGFVLGKAVEADLFELKNLAVGCMPPVVVGKDTGGKTFSLADYRGKVVVLDFWADWCPYCVAMYPLERELVKRYADKPFAMLGVNCDEPDRLKKVLDSKTVTWRNWADGRRGPIAQQWHIRSYPSIYVLDKAGVIRYKDLRGKELEDAVAKLLGIDVLTETEEKELLARNYDGKKASQNSAKASWSPDGKKLVAGKMPFGRGLQVVDLQTGKGVELLDFGKDPAWSSGDGRWIAFVREEGKDAERMETVWIVESSGKNPRKIAEGGWPSWSADGKTLFFHSRKEGRILAVQPDESKAAVATFCNMPWSFYPAVSPDGTQVSFADPNGLHILTRDGQKEVLSIPLPTKGCVFHSWSPDGKQIGVGDCYSQNSSDCGVWILDLKTKEFKKVASGRYTLPFWSADGSKIAVDYRWSAQDADVWVIEAKRLQKLK